ncbi:MAG TPA: FHA domain-containing protein [Ilumatobacteraceae bacterium]
MATRVESPLAVVVNEPGRVPIRILVDATQLEIGRDCEGLLLTDPTISRRHLSLRVVEGAVHVAVLGGTQGTCVGDQPLVGSHELQPNETVRFGHSTVELWDGSETDLVDAQTVMATIDLLQPALAGDPPVLALLGSAATSVTTVVLDIHDSRRGAAKLGAERWSAVLEAHSSIVRRHSIRARGVELACCGDAFMLAFASSTQAVRCTVDVQRAAQSLARSRPADAVQVRSGVHASDAVVRADPHLFVHHAAVATALAKAARGGEILVTGIVRELVERHIALGFGAPRPVPSLPGRDVRLAHPVLWATPPTPNNTRPESDLPQRSERAPTKRPDNEWRQQ